MFLSTRKRTEKYEIGQKNVTKSAVDDYEELKKAELDKMLTLHFLYVVTHLKGNELTTGQYEHKKNIIKKKLTSMVWKFFQDGISSLEPLFVLFGFI